MLKTKIMAFISIICLFNSEVLAENPGKDFYFKTIIGLYRNNNIKTADSDINFILNQRANLSPTFGIGVGYYVNSFSRIDLVFEHTNINFATESGAFRFSDNGITQFGIRTIKREANIQSLMLNGYVDIIQRPTFKMFCGLGIGVGSSRIKEKAFNRFDSNIGVNGNVITLPVISSCSTNKNKNILSYAFVFGGDFNINPGFNIELFYSWKYAGKIKVEDNHNKYRGHSVTGAFRFDI